MARWTLVLLAVVLYAERSVARDSVAHWYGSLYGGWMAPNSSHPSENAAQQAMFQGLGIAPVFHQQLNFNFEVERVFARDRRMAERSEHDFELSTASLMARYFWNAPAETDDWRPYVMAGIGLTEHEDYRGDSSSLNLSAGMGMQLRWEQRWSSYVQAMYRRDVGRIQPLNHHGLNDVVLSAGMRYAFD
ncbi:MAG: hypothetical protein MI750_10115 [Xanthomonadales bacterium]|jgi:hypothetical protein|nr:hypothetical protein [Xanthomonadales bacterium]